MNSSFAFWGVVNIKKLCIDVFCKISPCNIFETNTNKYQEYLALHITNPHNLFHFIEYKPKHENFLKTTFKTREYHFNGFHV